MTGTGHRLTGVGAAFMAAAFARLFSLPELPAALVAAGATTSPDWLELPIRAGGVRIGSLIPHRTITHWPFLWLGMSWVAVEYGGLLGACGLGFSVGAFVHILGDAPNPMGIPWLLPFHRVRLGQKGLWRSGQYEFLLAALFAGCGYGLWKLAGMIDTLQY